MNYNEIIIEIIGTKMSDLTYQLSVILLLKKYPQCDSRSYCNGSPCLEHHPL